MLLALLVVILAEKNAHGHPPTIKNAAQQEQASLQKESSCIICDFQLTPGAGLPAQPEIPVIAAQTIDFTIAPSFFYLQFSPSCLSERGPPFAC